MYALELKSVQTNSISFERSKEDKGIIHYYQIESLKKFSNYHNVVAGFILDFRSSDNTYFIDIDNFISMINEIAKKSFNEKDLLKYSPILIEKKKLKVNYRYNVKKFLEDTKLN